MNFQNEPIERIIQNSIDYASAKSMQSFNKLLKSQNVIDLIYEKELLSLEKQIDEIMELPAPRKPREINLCDCINFINQYLYKKKLDHNKYEFEGTFDKDNKIQKVSLYISHTMPKCPMMYFEFGKNFATVDEFLEKQTDITREWLRFAYQIEGVSCLNDYFKLELQDLINQTEEERKTAKKENSCELAHIKSSVKIF
ncbi:MAG: hypothetical protein RR140_01535 [Clostridia bacterium]